MLYMAATRTQIYLRADQRERIDRLAQELDVSLAEVVRRALDRYLEEIATDPEAAIDETFGKIADLEVPSRDDWDRSAHA